MHNLAWLLRIFLCGITIHLVHGNSVPVETVVRHVIPVLDTHISIQLAQLGGSHSKFHQLLNGELCQRAPDKLQRIMDYAYNIMTEVRETQDYEYDLALYGGLHSYFMHPNGSEFLFYLTLFVMDRSMDFRFLLRMCTMYCFVGGVTTETVDTKYNISSKANDVRDWMANNNCTDTELAQRFKAIIRNWKYTVALTQWVGINQMQMMNDDKTLHALWNDMLFVLKKCILKMLMRRQHYSQPHVQFFSNYNWLHVVNVVASTPQSSLVMDRLKSFEQAVIALFKTIADEYGGDAMDKEGQMSSNVSDSDQIWIHSVSFTDLSEVTPHGVQDVVDAVMRMDRKIGLENSEYENCVMYLCSLRTDVFRYIGINESVLNQFEQEQVHQLLSELDQLTAQVMSRLYNAHAPE